MKFSEIVAMNKVGIVVTALVLIAGLAAYFAMFGFSQNGGMQSAKMSGDAGIYGSLRIKTAFSEDGSMKLFALASNNQLAKQVASEGSVLPESGTFVIGNKEAAMMREEALFSKVGDKIYGLFGIDTAVGGILAKTNGPLDMMHFLSEKQFDEIKGENGRAYVKLTSDKVPKMFYRLALDEKALPDMEFAEGKLADYQVHELGSEKFHPVIIGADEAKMMRDEILFSRTGDTIRGFFGKNIVIVGVLKQSGTTIDMMHFIPLGENELS